MDQREKPPAEAKTDAEIAAQQIEQAPKSPPVTPDEEMLARAPGAPPPADPQGQPDRAAVREGNEESKVNQAILAAATRTQTAEQWGREKGHVVLRADGSADPTQRDYKKFDAARSANIWPVGAPITEADYDAGIAAADDALS